MAAVTLQSICHQPVDDVLSSLGTSITGLPPHEAERRLHHNGYNTLSTRKKTHILVEFLINFKSPLVVILILVSLISFSLGQTVNALIVLAMVVMSVCLNFFQEHRATTAADKLKAKVAPKAVVTRGGKTEEIMASHIVVGDIVELNAGDLVPADARLIVAKDVFVNQSALTGESFPVEKQAGQVTEHHPDLSEMSNIVYAGTSVVTGSAQAVVVKTGLQTEFGAIAEKISEQDEGNEFTHGIERFSTMILRIIIVFVIIIFFINALIKHDVFESLTFAIAVAVGLTPEFLPMIMTVTMSRGSVNMAKKGVIVKKLTAIPTFGSMDMLCTDKTGTLTEDRIQVVKYTDMHGHPSEQVFLYAYLNSSYQTGITNPMDQAVIAYKTTSRQGYEKIDEIPFDFERKRMSVVISHREKHIVITKGAPEEILTVCTHVLDGEKQRPFNPSEHQAFLSQYHSLSTDGFRVLAIAVKEVASEKTVYTKADEERMTVIGFIAFLDPAKKGVRASIDDLEAMGIEMKVVTGDNELVTKKICQDADIVLKGIILGHEIDALSDDALYEKALKTTIFARFSPIQKNRVISVLRSHGKVVGYMGDGINDAPSLKAADVGISVSNGVDVAKESADIILTNKSLHELKNGVIEGRKTFGNTMKYIMMGLSSNFGNMFSVLGAVLFLPFLPMLPIQILLNNFLYDISQLTLPLDNVDAEFIQKPKRWDMKQIRNFMILFGPISSIFDFLSFYLLYLLFSQAPGQFQTGWFIESLATQTLVIHVIRTRKIPFLQSNASPYLWTTTTAAVIVGWLIPYTRIGFFFGLLPLPLTTIIMLIAVVSLYLLSVETGKRLFYASRFSGSL